MPPDPERNEGSPNDQILLTELRTLSDAKLSFVLQRTQQVLEKERGEKPPSQPSQEISRRKFLQLFGGAAAGVVVGGAGFTLGRSSSPQPKATQSQAVEKPAPVLEPAKAAPVEAAPVKEKLPALNPNLGIRNDVLKLMPLVTEFGARNVRIDGGLSETSPDGKIKDWENLALLDETKRLGLDVLYVFNPQQLISREEIRARLKAILSRDQKITIELGNEPDDVNVPYWKDRNLETFAEFIKIASEETAKIKPDTKLVVGALVGQENIKQLVSHLEKKEVDIKKLTYAIHAYHSADEIWTRVASVKVATKGAPVMVTEAGITNEGGDNNPGNNIQDLVEIYRAARSVSDGPVFIHELPFGQDPITNEHYGLVSKETGQPRADFFTLKTALAKVEEDRLAKITAKTP